MDPGSRFALGRDDEFACLNPSKSPPYLVYPAGLPVRLGRQNGF